MMPTEAVAGSQAAATDPAHPLDDGRLGAMDELPARNNWPAEGNVGQDPVELQVEGVELP